LAIGRVFLLLGLSLHTSAAADGFNGAAYREYTDATFTTIKPRAAQDAYLGIVGPILYAEVGDTIKVVFKNNATHPYGMHPHGVRYEKDSEGANYNGGSGDMEDRGACIAPGATHNYTWRSPRPRRIRPQRSQFPVLALPLALRRAARCSLRPLSADSSSHGAAWTLPDGAPKDVDKRVRHHLHRHQRK
jgi:manganese oxidase